MGGVGWGGCADYGGPVDITGCYGRVLVAVVVEAMAGRRTGWKDADGRASGCAKGWMWMG